MNPMLHQIETLLQAALNPTELIVEDDSADHIGHANAGAGHYTVNITSLLFENKSRVARHQLVYQSLGDLMKSQIHALRIRAFAPGEV